jgi:hypothetical protein
MARIRKRPAAAPVAGALAQADSRRARGAPGTAQGGVAGGLRKGMACLLSKAYARQKITKQWANENNLDWSQVPADQRIE